MTYNTRYYILPGSIRRAFIESSSFTKRVDRAASDLLELIQTTLLEFPKSGAVIPGTGGLRKLRIADAGRGKGKRGGLRVVYLDLPSVERTYLLALYDKGEREDISPDEKRALRSLVARLKEEAG